MEEEESPRKVYVNSPIFTEEDAKTFQYVNPELGEELDEEGEYGAVEDPFPLHVNRKQRPNDYDQQQPANDDNEPDENDRPTLFRSSDWQYVVRQTDEKQTRRIVRNKQTYEDEVAERIEIEERTESHRDEVIRNNIPNLNLVDSEDDAVPTDSLELEISDGNHAAKHKHPAAKPKHPAAKLKHPAAKLKHPANKPIGKVEILRDSLEDGDLDYQDDDRETDVFRNTREEGKVQEIFRNGYYLHDDGANHRKPIAAFDGAASRPVRNSSHQNAPSQNKKASQVHQYRNGNSNRSDEGLSIKVTREHGEHQFHELSSVHEHSRAQGHTATASPPQNTRYLQQNHEPHINTRTTHAPQTELPEDPNSFKPGGNQFSRGFAVKKPAAFSSSPEKDFVEGNKQLATKPPKTKKTYGEIYFKKKTQENPNTVLPSYTSPGRRKVFSADHIDTLQYSYEPYSQRVKEKRNSFRGQDDGRVAAAEDVWRSRAENLAKRKSSGQNGKPSVPGGIRKYPSESKMDLKRSDLNDIRSKAIYGGRGGEGGSAPYLSRHHPPHHLDPLQQQRQQQQQQQQQQQPWVTTTNHQVVPNNMYVQDAAQQQLQQLQQHQLLQKQQYQQQLPQQQQFQQIQDQQQQQFQQQQFQQMQKQELHRQQVQQQHMQQQQLQQQQLHQQQLQQHQLQQQQLQQQQLQQQQLQQQPLYQQQQQQLLQQQQQQMKQQELQHQLNMQPPPLPMQQLNQQRQPLQRQQLLIQQQQRQADPSYGGNVNPVQHILTTEDGRKVSVDINLKVVKPSSQASGIPIQPGLQQAQHFPAQQQQMPYNGGYPATVYQPITGQVFQEVLPSNPYAPVVLNPGFHQVVGQQYAYSQLPVENHPKVMNQTGFPPQSYGTALPVSAKAEQSGQHLPPKTKHPMSPFRVLPPVAQPLRQQNNNGQTVPPLKFNDQTTIIAGRGLDEGAGGGGGGYMDQYQKQKNRQQDYKQYTLGDYRRLQKEAKLSSLGSLGPDVDSEYHRDKKEKALRQQEYAKQIKQRNRVELEQQRQRQGNLLSPSSANEQSESKAKRAIALDYAKNVPKPQTVIRSADSKHTPTIASSGKKQTIRNRRPSDSQLPQPRHHLNEDAEFWYQQQQHPLQPMTADLDIDFDELQKLRERHEQERQRLEMLLQNNHVVLPQNA